MTKAIVTTIHYAGLEFEGLMLPDGNYAIAVSQAFKLLDPSVLLRNQLRKVKSLLGKDISVLKISSEINSNKVNILTLDLYSQLLMKLAFTGNELAQNFLLASTTEKLERVFDKAFDIVREEREREARFAARLSTKATFRPMTDQLKRLGFTESWEYGKFIRIFQETLDIECGTRDLQPLDKLMVLSNHQAVITHLLKNNVDPWIALKSWQENL